MDVRRVTCACVAGLALGTLGVGAGTAAAQPGGSCGPQGCQGGPGGPQPQPGGPGGPGPQPGGPGGGGPQPGGPGGPGGPPPPGSPPGGPQGPGDWHPGPGEWRPGPPPGLAWRGIDQGRFDHQPFSYNNAWVTPVFDQGRNAWGFRFLGVWIPL